MSEICKKEFSMSPLLSTSTKNPYIKGDSVWNRGAFVILHPLIYLNGFTMARPSNRSHTTDRGGFVRLQGHTSPPIAQTSQAPSDVVAWLAPTLMALQQAQLEMLEPLVEWGQKHPRHLLHQHLLIWITSSLQDDLPAWPISRSLSFPVPTLRLWIDMKEPQ